MTSSFSLRLETSCFLIDSQTPAYPVVFSGKRKVLVQPPTFPRNSSHLEQAHVVDVRHQACSSEWALGRVRSAGLSAFWKPRLHWGWGGEAAIDAKVAEEQQNVCVQRRVRHEPFLRQVSLWIYVAGTGPL